MLTQTVVKIGNSLGVTLPSEFVTKNKVKAGAKIAVTHSNGSITYSPRIPKSTHYEAATDDEWFKLIKEVEKNYGNALDELAMLQ